VGQAEPHAMTLSTADSNGTPDARIIILKDVTPEGWWFASSGLSAKGVQLNGNPHAALTFYWPTAGRAVRLRGTAVASPLAENAHDFSRRNEAAKAVIIGSPQSQPLDNRLTSEQAVAAAKQRLEQEPSLIFEPWTLWHLQPDTAEFWQADAGRQHVRITYSRNDDGWDTGMLWA
jgi:pyridoxamine 5'-phosphate oxidase